MKTNHLLFIFLLTLFSACNNDDDNNSEIVTVATPEFMSKTDFRKSVDIIEPQSIQEPGKIYAYKNYIFVNDVNKGVHVLDNTNPRAPKAIKYIEIPGNEDISVKDDFLYADSATDLVVFDISDINNITIKDRLHDVFEVYNYRTPIEAQAFDYVDFDYETDIIVGWNLKQERREKINNDGMVVDFVFNDVARATESTVGQGGSLARFQIVEDYLYTVGPYNMSIFNIQNLAAPNLETTQHVGWNIETMFQTEGYLYLGSTNGMYIYTLEAPESPAYVSDFTHWEGCDPVVVDGDYAYLTLRGGNFCGQDESVLEVIDISDKTNPTLAGRHELDNPYGLGIKGNTLFICDGTSGLKLFNKEDPANVKFIRQLKNIQSKDVIPLEDKLIMIGDNTLYQYEYIEDSVSLLSAYVLN